jgi:RNA ligase
VKLAEANSRPDGSPTSGISTEGYVIRYANGLRAKVKLAEYVRLHKVLTGITERDIWRMIGLRKFADQPAKLVAKALGCPAGEVGAATGDPLAALLDAVPDEFDQWVKSVAARLEHELTMRQAAVEMAYTGISNLASDRGAFARAVQTISDPGTKAAMFLRLDGKPTGLHLWRSIRPESVAPYTQDDA